MKDLEISRTKKRRRLYVGDNEETRDEGSLAAGTLSRERREDYRSNLNGPFGTEEVGRASLIESIESN